MQLPTVEYDDVDLNIWSTQFDYYIIGNEQKNDNVSFNSSDV
jgi:hypothetical protein